MLKKSFARLGPAPQRSQVIDLPLWGGAMRCQRSIRRDFFSSLPGHETLNPNLVRKGASLRDIVRILHPHERIHVDPKRLSEPERHFTGKIRLGI